MKKPRELVPCVQVTDDFFGWRAWAWVPVIGPLHEDRAIIEFPDDHWHIDWRYAGLPQFLDATEDGIGYRYFPGREHGRVIRRRCTTGEVRLKRMCRHRETPEYPDVTKITWFTVLEAAYSDARMKCKTCPHRGLPLDGLPVKDGVITCTGHGLKWNIETGALCPSV